MQSPANRTPVQLHYAAHGFSHLAPQAFRQLANGTHSVDDLLFVRRGTRLTYDISDLPEQVLDTIRGDLTLCIRDCGKPEPAPGLIVDVYDRTQLRPFAPLGAKTSDTFYAPSRERLKEAKVGTLLFY